MNTLTHSHRRFERRFYLAATLAFLALVFWTFARTYYLKYFFATPKLSTLVHIHGAVMSGWVALLVVQTALVAARRVQWHRWLGALGAVWAILVVVLGSTTTVHAAAREVRNHSATANVQLFVTTLELMQMLLFAMLTGSAIGMRRRPDYHKRLMLLTIACMLPSAVARLPVSFIDNQTILISLNVFVLACVGTDTLRHRRLHPAFGIGASLVLVALDLTFYWATSPWWISVGTALLS